MIPLDPLVHVKCSERCRASGSAIQVVAVTVANRLPFTVCEALLAPPSSPMRPTPQVCKLGPREEWREAGRWDRMLSNQGLGEDGWVQADAGQSAVASSSPWTWSTEPPAFPLGGWGAHTASGPGSRPTWTHPLGKEGRRQRLMKCHLMLITCKAFN